MVWQNPIRITILSLPLLALASCLEIGGTARIVLQPGDDVQAAVAKAPIGASFVFEPGIYRTQVITPKDSQKFIGKPGAILSGAKRLTGWRKNGELWSVGGLPKPLHRSGYCNKGFELCTHREDLFIDGVLYRRVGSPQSLGPQTWYFKDNTAHLNFNPAGRLVELGVAPRSFGGSAKRVVIQDLIVEKYASEAQHGAIDGSRGEDWRLFNVHARWNHGGGLAIGKRMRVEGGTFSNNGQIGIVGKGDDAIISGVEIAYNNYANFNWGWEAGGTKISRSNYLIIRNSCVHDNIGPGLWTDIDNINIIIKNNKVFDNAGDGIKHEISYKATISGNTVARNGKDNMNWLWSSQILVQNSSDVDVQDNYVEVAGAFGNGISLIYQKRGAGAHGPYVTTNVRVHDNTIVYLAKRGASGMVADYEIPKFENDTSNVFNKNTYIIAEPGQALWRDNSGDSTWNQLRKSRYEPEGILQVEQRAATPLACDR